jgi:hypothetical protein
MKMSSGHIIAAILIAGLVIYMFSKRKVTGTVTADQSNASVTPSSSGTVSYGTELQGS